MIPDEFAKWWYSWMFSVHLGGIPLDVLRDTINTTRGDPAALDMAWSSLLLGRWLNWCDDSIFYCPKTPLGHRVIPWSYKVKTKNTWEQATRATSGLHLIEPAGSGRGEQEQSCHQWRNLQALPVSETKAKCAGCWVMLSHSIRRCEKY